MARMARLDRLLTLVGALNDTAEGLTLDEMAEAIGSDRRTAERLRDVIRLHFELEEELVDRRKRFRIRGTLRRVYTRPNAAELAALQAAAEGARRAGATHAPLLETLGAKVRAALDDREKRRLDPDLEPLARLQRQFVPAGPLATGDPASLTQVQGAIMAGQCLEFDYLREGWEEPRWRRVIPMGLIHGPVTYLIGQMPGRDQPPVPYRLDRMSDARIGNEPGCPAEDWDLDAWMAGSFGIWREEGHDVVLRVSPGAMARGRAWRFHPGQVVEQDGDELVVRFHAGGLREIADHLFTWGGEVRIEAPEELRAVMRDRLVAAAASV
ncbi:hypothetical protein PK98_11415 [Croceibacterium mercuriale]|uniref:Uncharacterized protein n=1 Tax=Croceibacterium mercuriale TaxID=1572751 RepID=A0A0B2BT23_9SPHN|nr:WYL domain-containing protein [Croceibacterium mercuriale]KHL24584.1 hypothetical protein PK98_11415 [Croceibacterium mercuriale]